MPTAIQLGTSVGSTDRVSTALPAAAATATPTGYLDLGPQRGVNQPFLKLQVSVPATPALADTKTITFSVWNCDTSGGTYTAIADLTAVLTQTGAGGAGDTADSVLIPVANHWQRYIKVKAAVASAGGDNTGVSYVMELVRDFNG